MLSRGAASESIEDVYKRQLLEYVSPKATEDNGGIMFEVKAAGKKMCIRDSLLPLAHLRVGVVFGIQAANVGRHAEIETQNLGEGVLVIERNARARIGMKP